MSPHKGRFLLKGASLFLVWEDQNYRVTRDADLLGLGDPDLELLTKVFCDIYSVECKNDGMIYHPDSLNVEEISEDHPSMNDIFR